MTGRTGNAEQAERWNGEGGRQWVAHRERHRAGHQRLLPHLFRAAAIAPGDRVLDVGCGCGETTIAAARSAAGPASPGAASGPAAPAAPGRDELGPGGGSALGLDLSGLMLEVARRLAAEARVANVRFEQGDAQIVPLRRDFYDVVISTFGVMFFDDPAAAFANIAAAARPGGRLAFLCWQDDEHNEMFAIPLGAFLACPGLSAPPRSALFQDPGQITALLTGAGWQDARVDAVSEPARMGADVADVMDYVRGMPMLRGLAAQLGDDALTERVLASVAEQYAARQRPDGVWIQAGAWLVTARGSPA